MPLLNLEIDELKGRLKNIDRRERVNNATTMGILGVIYCFWE